MDALRRLGHEVECIWADKLPHRIPHGNLHYLLELPRGMMRAIEKRYSERQFDVIHASQPHCWLAARDHQRMRRSGVFVQRSHGWEIRVHEALRPWRALWSIPEKRFPSSVATATLRGLLERHNRLAVAHCDGTLVSSTLCRDFIVQRHGASRDRVAVIPQSAPDLFVGSPCHEATAERQRRILYVGQFQFVKGPHVLADAFRRIGEVRPDVSFTWVCDRTHHRSARKLLGPVSARCDMVEWKNQTELMKLYDSHGIFLFPSLFEGFGKAFMEAMSRGMCVIASDEGGMHDVIHHDQNGFLAPVGDAAQIVHVARLVMSDYSRFRRICVKARETAEQYTWDRVAAELASFYDRLLAWKSTQQPA
jgi:glycosyltransferase involved in cell wall biosynthesis